MRVGIDGRILGSGIGGGDTYIRNIVRVLRSVDAETDYTLFLCPSQADLAIEGAGTMHRVVVGPNALQIRIPVTLPIALRRARVDLAHFHFLAPLICPTRSVVQVHDISYERLPQCHPKAYVLQYRLMMPLVLRHAAAVITISEFSRRDIVRRYCLPPDRDILPPAPPIEPSSRYTM